MVDRLNQLIERAFPIYALVAIGSGLLFDNVGASAVALAAPALALQMFLTSLSVRASAMWQAIRSPFPLILWALIAWGVAPAVSFALGKTLLAGHPEFAAGLVLTATLPAAVTSGVWTAISRGNLAINVTIIGAASLLCGIVTPLLLSGWVGVLIEVDSVGLFVSFLLTVMIPTLVGVATHEVARGRVEPFRPATRLAVKGLIGFMLFVNAAVLKPHLWSWGSSVLGILAIVLLQTAVTYALVLLIGSRFRSLSRGNLVALTYATGMRNNTAGIVIALAYFGPVVAAPVILSILMQQPAASLVDRLVLRRAEFRKARRTQDASSGA